jgi:hypothetical protein
MALRVVAVLLWSAVAFLTASTAFALTTPEMIDRFEQAPILFVTTAIVALALPLTGFSLLGVALWRRSRWPAIFGITAFLPLVLMILRLIIRGASPP